MSKYEKIVGLTFDKVQVPLTTKERFILLSNTIKYKDLVVLERPECEKDNNYRHFATYCIIQNPQGKIFTYNRPDKNNESRLNGKLSIGIGGHLNVDLFNDIHVEPDETVDALFKAGSFKEIEEELYDNLIPENIKSEIQEKLQASSTLLLLDDADEVGKFHIAVISRIVISDEAISKIKRNPEIDSFEWLSMSELQEKDKLARLENWSNILVSNFSSMPSCKFPAACQYGEFPFSR